MVTPLLTLLKGIDIIIYKNDGSIIDGILGNIINNNPLEFNILYAQVRDNNNSRNTNPFIECLKIKNSEFHRLEIYRVNNNVISDRENSEFRIDSQISGSENLELLNSRQLTKWVSDSNELLDDKSLNDMKYGQWDQFNAEANKKQFAQSGAVPYSDEHYTTTIDKTFYKKVEKDAERIARDIESNYESGNGRDADGAIILNKNASADSNEEDLFSTVQKIETTSSAPPKRFYNSALGQGPKVTATATATVPATVEHPTAPASNSYAAMLKAKAASNNTIAAKPTSATASTVATSKPITLPTTAPVVTATKPIPVPATAAQITAPKVVSTLSSNKSIPATISSDKPAPASTTTQLAASVPTTTPTPVVESTAVVIPTVTTTVSSPTPSTTSETTSTTSKSSFKFKLSAKAASFVPIFEPAVVVAPVPVPQYAYAPAYPQQPTYYAAPQQYDDESAYYNAPVMMPMPVAYDAYGYPIPVYNQGMMVPPIPNMSPYDPTKPNINTHAK